MTCYLQEQSTQLQALVLPYMQAATFPGPGQYGAPATHVESGHTSLPSVGFARANRDAAKKASAFKVLLLPVNVWMASCPVTALFCGLTRCCTWLSCLWIKTTTAKA